MNTPSPSIRRLARQLVAASKPGPDPLRDETLQVCDTLRASLTRLAGGEGYASLLRRAIVLASSEIPALVGATLGSDGRLILAPPASPRTNAATVPPKELDSHAATAITSHLLGLLVTLIGETLVLRLVLDARPDVSFAKPKLPSEAES